MRLSIAPGSLSDPRPTSGVRLGRSQDEASWGKHVVKLILRLLLELQQRQKLQQEAVALADRIGSRLGGDDEARTATTSPSPLRVDVLGRRLAAREVAAELNQHHPRRLTNSQASALSSSLADDDSPGSDGP
jgi:hypothetical protein